MSVSSEKLTETAAESGVLPRERSSASASVHSEEASMAAMLGMAMRRISGATEPASRSPAICVFMALLPLLAK